LGQPPQGSQNVITPPEIAKREFAQHERMAKHLAAAEQLRQ
jgi:hypothetical protein